MAADAPTPAVRTSELDAPSYAEGEEGRRCLDCVMSWQGYGDEVARQGCRLYAFDTENGYKPWYVCSSFRAPQRMGYGEARVAFAAVGDKEDDGSVWIELVRSGTHYSGHKGGTAASGQKKIDITADWIASLARGAAAILADGRYPTGIPIRLDPTHGDPDGVAGAACGRVKEVSVDELADGVTRLLGRVAWTAEGAEAVTAGRFDSVSIEADPPKSAQDKRTGKQIDDWTLSGVVVTNAPFIAGMEPLAASDRQAREKQMFQIRAALKLAESADEAAVLAEIATLRAEAEKVPVVQATLDDVQAKLAEAREKVAASDARETERLLDAYCAAGRIDAGKRDDVKLALSTMGREWVERNFPESAVKTAPKSSDGADPNQAGVTRLATVQAKAAKYVEQGLSAPVAFARADNETPAADRGEQ